MLLTIEKSFPQYAKEQCLFWSTKTINSVWKEGKKSNFQTYSIFQNSKLFHNSKLITLGSESGICQFMATCTGYFWTRSRRKREELAGEQLCWKGWALLSDVPWQPEGSSTTPCSHGSTAAESSKGIISFAAHPQRRDCAVPVRFLRPNWIHACFTKTYHNSIMSSL